MAISVIHASFGLWYGRGALSGIVADGVINAVDPHMDRNAVFWFLFASPTLWILGQLIVWLDRRGLRPPIWLGVQLLAVTIAGAVLMPVSGFWLLFAPSLMLIAAARAGGGR